MYTLATSVIGMPIVSLQSGHGVAKVQGYLIKPDSLELLALYCEDPRFRRQQAVLLMQDIREVAQNGIIIDKPEDIDDITEVIRLQQVAEQKFELMGCGVYAESGHKLGTVEDFTFDTTSFVVQKLYIKQSMLRNLLSSNLVVDRSQIVDVTPKRITVRDATAVVPKLAGTSAPTEPA